ncbi:MAG: hypothetical protein PVSMB7_23180 [Chloroflexota bacterium]
MSVIDVLEILERRKDHPMATAAPDDFVCRTIGTADASIVVNDPTVSLYCLDHAARRAVFVQVPREVDITAGPFFYLEQYTHAWRILTMPYAVFHQVAAGIDLRAPLVFIYSTGRAGSTLMSKAFEAMESVTSLSEPDAYTQAVALRFNGERDPEIRDLVTSATKVLLKPSVTGGSSLSVVKFRSFCIEICDLLCAAFPQAGSLFLYRDVDASIRSRARVFGTLDRPPEVARGITARLATMTPLLDRELKQREDLDAIEVLCLVWLSTVHAYARCRRDGIAMLPVRYEELIADPPRVLGGILTYLGLSANGMHSALRAFHRDAQAGSPLAREETAHRAVHIDDHRWALVRDLLRRYPVSGVDLVAASFIVP